MKISNSIGENSQLTLELDSKIRVLGEAGKNKDILDILDIKNIDDIKLELDFLESKVIEVGGFINLPSKLQKKLKNLRLINYEIYKLLELRKMKLTEPMTQREVNELEKLENKYKTFNISANYKKTTKDDLTKFAQELFDSKAA